MKRLVNYSSSEDDDELSMNDSIAVGKRRKLEGTGKAQGVHL
jgi:hypothetical protein